MDACQADIISTSPADRQQRHSARSSRGGLMIFEQNWNRAMGSPNLGFVRYRALDGVSDYAAIVTLLEGGQLVSLTCFHPGGAQTHFTHVRFDSQATPETAKRGTCYISCLSGSNTTNAETY